MTLFYLLAYDTARLLFFDRVQEVGEEDKSDGRGEEKFFQGLEWKQAK